MNANVKTKGSDAAAVRPFNVNVPEAELTELRKRINSTRWPVGTAATFFRRASRRLQIAAILAGKFRATKLGRRNGQPDLKDMVNGPNVRRATAELRSSELSCYD